MRVRAHVKNGRLLIDEATTLPEGTVLDLVVDREGELAFGTLVLLAPPVLAAAWGLVGRTFALPLGATILAGVFFWLLKSERALADATLTPRLRRVSLLLLFLAMMQITRVSVYMQNNQRPGWSAAPWNVFMTQHAPLGGYTEAARLARERTPNIYDSRHYEDAQGLSRKLGTFEIAEYDSPPTFLVMPYAASAATDHEFLRTRALWFGFQAMLLTFAYVGTAVRLAPEAAVVAWRLLPALWLALPTLAGLQSGAFQTGSFALAILGMLACTRGRSIAGALSVACSVVSQIFPGLLVLPLVAARRWKAVALITFWTAALVGVSMWLFGPQPYLDFWRYELPGMTNGSAFPWTDELVWIPPNFSVYGMVAKLRLLGAPGATPGVGYTFAALYGLLVVALLLLLTWRACGVLSPARRAWVESPVAWLAILNLASFRSLYVADAYAAVGTLWMLALLLARDNPRRALVGCGVLAWVVWSIALEGMIPDVSNTPLTMVTLVIQAGAIAFNLWALLREAALIGSPVQGIAGADTPRADLHAAVSPSVAS